MARGRRFTGGRRARRMTDWEANSPQSTSPVVTLSGVVTAQVLFPRSVLSTAGARSTLTRVLLHFDAWITAAAAQAIVHVALVVASLDVTPALQVFDPTAVADLNKGGILWQKQFALSNDTDILGGPLSGYRVDIDAKGQRKLREDEVIAFFIEPNGATVSHHIGGRALLKLV